MARPNLSSVATASSNSVLITWDQTMDLTGVALLPSSYTVDGFSALSVAIASPSSVSVTFDKDQKAGESYTLTVDPAIKNSLAEYMNPAGSSMAWVANPSFITMPALSSVAAFTSTGLRVVWNKRMKKNDALSDAANWSVTVLTPGAPPVFVLGVTASNDAEPLSVEVEVTEMKDAASYQLTASGSQITDAAGNEMTGLASTQAFTGSGQIPTVLSVQPVSATQVLVTFSEPMANNSDLRDAAKYTWVGGLLTLSVSVESATVVRLTTTTQEPGVDYTLTVEP